MRKYKFLYTGRDSKLLVINGNSHLLGSWQDLKLRHFSRENTRVKAPVQQNLELPVTLAWTVEHLQGHNQQS